MDKLHLALPKKRQPPVVYNSELGKISGPASAKTSYAAEITAWRDQGVAFTEILRDRSLGIKAGEKVGIVGPSGSGKSITFSAAFGLLHPFLEPHLLHSDLKFAGKSYTPAAARKLLGHKVAILFQDAMSSFHPYFRVGFQFRFFLKRLGIGPAKKRNELISEWMERVGLPEEKLKSYPSQLSGGMLQRINLAMGFATGPELVIADESTSALDVTTQASIIRWIDRLVSEQNTALFFISHDDKLVGEFCDRVEEYQPIGEYHENIAV